MLYYRDYEGYESQLRHENSDQRSGLSAEGQLVVEWLQSAPQPLDGMPRGNEEGVPMFSGHPDDLIWCPTVCYSKCNLYDLVDKQKKYVDDPWPTYQVAREAERLLKEGYCFELREAHLARDQWSTREAQYEAEMQESRAVQTKEQCQRLEKCSESKRLGSKASQSPSSTLLEIQSLTRNLQDSLKPSKAPGVGLRSQVVEVDGIKVAVAEPSSLALVEGQCKSSFEHIENSSIEPQHAEDEPRVNERPIEAVACVPELPKPTLEPRGDLCKVPEQVRSIKVEEIKLEVEAEGQLKGWTRSLRVETCTMSLSALSQPAKRSGTTVLHVNNAHSLAPHTCSAAAVEINAGYESLEGKVQCLRGVVLMVQVKAPHSGGWSTILKSTAISSARKPTEEAASRVRTPKIPCKKKWTPPCVEGEAQQLQEGPHSCYMECYIEFSRLQGWGLSQSKAQAPTGTQDKTQALPFVFTLEGVLGLPRRRSLEWTSSKSEEVAKRSPFLVYTDDIRSSKNPLKVKRQEE
ncbi:hypothetical protein EDD17DRAFT_1508717 [Pisolithus thermaeus]|nr:hypothetical protein EDD17DRAFT_1508717 [Pisolithus thermaeus]